jgi:hypothetical protein
LGFAIRAPVLAEHSLASTGSLFQRILYFKQNSNPVANKDKGSKNDNKENSKGSGKGKHSSSSEDIKRVLGSPRY